MNNLLSTSFVNQLTFDYYYIINCKRLDNDSIDDRTKMYYFFLSSRKTN